ncbi:MAG: aminopeptidase P family protein [Bacteroidales bacterium]|nr:aminopeptidase P family protein [Bacteroidales bacterium]
MYTPIQKLRTYMADNNLSAFIVPSNDPYFSEYIPDRYACRGWLSGFRGSAGTLVITLDKAALWTDSRYFVRAEQEMAGRGIELKKLKMPGTESIEEWLLEHCPAEGIVGIDGALFALPEFERMREALHPLTIYVDRDPFDALWEERPDLPNAPAYLLDERYSGASVSQKHHAVRKAFAAYSDFIYPVVALDDVAWLLNMRGSDVVYNPLAIANAAVTPQAIHLFIECTQLPAETRLVLEKEGVVFHPADHFASFLSEYPNEAERIITQERWSIALHLQTILEQGLTITSDPYRGGCIAHLKSQKNQTEQDGFRIAMKKEAIAWIRLWRYIEEQLPFGTLTEQLLASKIAEFRALDPDYRGESFFPILGYAQNGAMPHYAMDINGSTPIKAEGFLLIDSGGHYLYGTTDTTRTFAMGPLTAEQKRDYTAVLRGMIGLSMAKFPAGTRGALLDILARGPVWSVGRSYLHGTGHGIGHFLNVHEGPQNIRMEENPVPLAPGMVLSNEPGIYVLDAYGIRTENMMICVQHEENLQGTFYKFETITRCPIDTAGVDTTLLGEEARTWLNDYHATAYKELAPLLTQEEATWLKEKTKAI